MRKETCELLPKVEIVFEVRGNSAEPLALAGQLILGGPNITSTTLAQSEGRPAAIAITEGAALKRVGKCLDWVLVICDTLNQSEDLGNPS